MFLSSSSCSCSCSSNLSSFCSSLFLSRIFDVTWDNHLFIIVMFIAYFDYMSSIVRLALGLYSCSYNAYPESPGVSGRCCVGVVLRHHLSANAPYVLGRVVDREGDYYSFIESSVVYPSNIGLVEPGREGNILLCF
jgi:hypothetical protein